MASVAGSLFTQYMYSKEGLLPSVASYQQSSYHNHKRKGWMAQPREKHIEMMYGMFGYIKEHPECIMVRDGVRKRQFREVDL